MSSLSETILQFLTSALISALILSLLPKGLFREILKLLCGLFVTISLLYPLRELDLSSLFWGIFTENAKEGEAAAALGKEFADSLLAERIKEATKEYILDKAASLGTELTVEVMLSQEDIPVPVSVILTGDMEPMARSRLEQYLCAELEIAKEDIQWTQVSSAKRDGT